MKYFAAALFCFLLSAQGAPLFQLPKIVATVNGSPLSAEEIRKSWRKAIAELPEHIDPETLERIFRSMAEQCVWQHELKQMLSEANIKIDRNTAKKYLEVQRKKYPVPPEKLISSKIDSQLDSFEFQLKSAIYFYLRTAVPQKIKVSRTEVVELYRSMPEKFRIPGKENWGIIEVKDLQTAQKVRALLLQGGSFASAAKRFSPQGMRSTLPGQLVQLGSGMKINDITPVIKSEKGWVVAKLHSREKSRLLPLEKVYDQLAVVLEESKEAAALKELLQKRLSGKKIIYSSLIRRKSR